MRITYLYLTKILLKRYYSTLNLTIRLNLNLVLNYLNTTSTYS
jgi:hypothetical protein